MKKQLTARYYRGDTGGGDTTLVIEIEELEGCVTQAESIAHGRNRIREAISLWLEDDHWESTHTLSEIIPLELMQ